MLKRMKQRILLHEGGARGRPHGLVTAAVVQRRAPPIRAVGGGERGTHVIHLMIPEILGRDVHRS